MGGYKTWKIEELLTTPLKFSIKTNKNEEIYCELFKKRFNNCNNLSCKFSDFPVIIEISEGSKLFHRSKISFDSSCPLKDEIPINYNINCLITNQLDVFITSNYQYEDIRIPLKVKSEDSVCLSQPVIMVQTKFIEEYYENNFTSELKVNESIDFNNISVEHHLKSLRHDLQEYYSDLKRKIEENKDLNQFLREKIEEQFVETKGIIDDPKSPAEDFRKHKEFLSKFEKYAK